MGTLSLWDRLWPWLRHPVSTAAATIAFRYVENQPDLEIRWSAEARRRMNPCTCGPNEGCSSCPAVMNESDLDSAAKMVALERDIKNAVSRLHKRLVDIAFDEEMDVITSPASMDHDEVEGLAYGYQQVLREIRATLIDPGWMKVL